MQTVVIKQEVSFVEMTAVENSSQIAAIGYDQSAKVLHVQFHSGGTYAYEDVPADMADAFAKSDSKGRFLSTHIKGRHPYRQVS